jgi:hypothetical protein
MGSQTDGMTKNALNYNHKKAILMDDEQPPPVSYSDQYRRDISKGGIRFQLLSHDNGPPKMHPYDFCVD